MTTRRVPTQRQWIPPATVILAIGAVFPDVVVGAVLVSIALLITAFAIIVVFPLVCAFLQDMRW